MTQQPRHGLGAHVRRNIADIEGTVTKKQEEIERLAQRARNTPAIELLRSWRNATGSDAEEQRTTYEILERAENQSKAEGSLYS